MQFLPKHSNANRSRMKPGFGSARRVAFALVAPTAALLLAGVAIATQDSGQSPELDELDKLMNPPSPQDELMRLFGEVELRLREVDDLLFDAAAEEDFLFDDIESGLGDLLRDTEDKSREAIAGIDEILEIAQQMSQQSQSGGQQGQQSQQQQNSGEQQNQGGQSPLNRQQSEQSRGQEQSSEAPNPELEQAENQSRGGQEPSSGQPEGQDDAPPGGQPDDGQPSDGSEQQVGPHGPGEDTTAPANGARAAGEWGELPPRIQEIFDNRAADDVPVRYRDWIDSYYRRLSRSR